MAGKCVVAAAGTVVPGSCGDVMACDGTGSCKTANGQACGGNDACASGHCADGMCCDTDCTGACMACNLRGSLGRCSPYPRGTDPDNECAGGGVCGATCDGVSGCAFPSPAAPCGTCGACDGAGLCREPAVCYPDGGFHPDAYPFPRPDGPFFPPPYSDAARPLDAPRGGTDARPVDASRSDGPRMMGDGATADGPGPDDAGGPADGRLPGDARVADARSGDAGDGGVKGPALRSSGCGCDLGARPPRPGALAAVALAALVLRRRRRGGQ